MNFDEFAKRVSEMAGKIPCAVSVRRGFNGVPTVYSGEVEAYPGYVVRTEAYEEPTAALAEFAGVLALIQMRHETWLQRLEVASLSRCVEDLTQKVQDLERNTEPESTIGSTQKVQDLETQQDLTSSDPERNTTE